MQAYYCRYDCDGENRQGGIAVPLPKADMAAGAKAAVDPTTSVAPGAMAMAPASEGAHPAPPKKQSAATERVRAAIQTHKKAWMHDPKSSARPVLILPEGTAHSGQSMLKFFSGAFDGGGPVQPVLLGYPKTLGSNAAFYAGTLAEHAVTLLCVPWQRMNVTYMAVHTPTEDEEADAELYAERVRKIMARAANLPLSEYSARELRKELKEKALSKLNGHRE